MKKSFFTSGLIDKIKNLVYDFFNQRSIGDKRNIYTIVLAQRYEWYKHNCAYSIVMGKAKKEQLQGNDILQTTKYNVSLRFEKLKDLV